MRGGRERGRGASTRGGVKRSAGSGGKRVWERTRARRAPTAPLCCPDACCPLLPQGTSAEGDPCSRHLGVQLLPSLSVINAQVAAVGLPTPQRRARAFAVGPSAVVLPPTQLDALDCIALDYQVGWPLSAVVTEVRGAAEPPGLQGWLPRRAPTPRVPPLPWRRLADPQTPGCPPPLLCHRIPCKGMQPCSA